jgi:transposase-like protein
MMMSKGKFIQEEKLRIIKEAGEPGVKVNPVSLHVLPCQDHS